MSACAAPGVAQIVDKDGAGTGFEDSSTCRDVVGGVS